MRVFRYLKGYVNLAVMVAILLLIQAFCDLSLPEYTSKIIDTGIQNQGIEHVLPEKIKEEEFTYAEIFMKEEEISKWESAYKKQEGTYVRKELSEEAMEKYDELFSIPLIASYQMSSVEQKEFFSQLEKQMGMEPGSLTVEQVQQILGKMGMTYEPRERKTKKGTEYYVDERPILLGMIAGGNTEIKENMIAARDNMEEKFSSMGEALVQSTAISYTIKQEKACGIDVNKKQTTYLWQAGAKMLAMAFLMAVASVLVSLLASKIGAGVGRDLRGKLYTKIMSFSAGEMDRFSTASLITRSTNDVQQIQMVEVMLLRMVLYAPIIGLGGIIKVVNTKSGMGWIIVVAVVALFAVIMFLLKLAMPKFKKMQVLVDRVNLVSREILTGLPVIRAFSREKKEEERFEDANVALTRNMLFTNRVMMFMMPCMMFIMFGVSVLIVWVSAGKIDQGTIQVGTMTAFITYAMQIVMAFLMLTMLSVFLPRATVASERIDEVLETPLSIEDTPEAEELHNHSGEVVFEDVAFSYPGGEEKVLDHISFTAKPGEVTAIIGGTGSGKSTLINLIPRFYDVTEGRITVGGKDVRKITQGSLREQIGYVPQKGVLFSGTIASNLKYGKKDATREQVEEAVRIAQAKEIVEGKADGYDSHIAQGGSNVSGGQKQRFSIARAIVKNPKIYIFDDSFSALDYKTDAALRRELSEKTKDATVFIVAQRISTILHANQIIVLDEGRITGIGTHQQLLKNCETYREIAASQLSEEELEQTGKEEK